MSEFVTVGDLKRAITDLPDDMMVIVRGFEGETCGITSIDAVQHLFGEHDDGEEAFMELSITEIEYDDEPVEEESSNEPVNDEIVIEPEDIETAKKYPKKAEA